MHRALRIWRKLRRLSRSCPAAGGHAGGLSMPGDCVGVSASGAAIALSAGLGVVDERLDACRPGAGADPVPATPGDEQSQAAGRDGLDPGHDVIALREEVQMGTGSVMGRQRDPPRGAFEERVDGTASLINGFGCECQCQFSCPTSKAMIRISTQPRFPNAEIPQHSLKVVSCPGVYQGSGQLGSHLIFVTVSHPQSVMVERHQPITGCWFHA